MKKTLNDVYLPKNIDMHTFTSNSSVTIHDLRAKESPQSPKVTMALLFRLAIAEFFKMSDKDIINLIRKEQLSETEQDLFS